MIRVDRQDYKKKSKDELIDDIERLLNEKDDLEKEIKKYKNSNTPSSANKHLKKNTAGTKAKIGAKRGAPKGHRGATLLIPPPDKIINVTSKTCNHCHNKNIIATGTITTKTIICLQQPKLVVKKYCCKEYACVDCGTVASATHNDIPEKGMYDKTIQSIVNYARFKARMPHKIIADMMKNMFGVPMTPATSLAITNRTSEQLAEEYHDIEKKIQESKIVQGDETSHSVNGINYWVWTFCNKLYSLFKFHKERGGNIVETTLGKTFTGVIVADGWRTYKTYAENNNVLLQRCWSHGLREVKFECETKHPDLYRWYCDIYDMAKKGKNYKQEKRRQTMYDKCNKELERWITSAQVHNNLKKIVTKIKNGGKQWFTAILHPNVPLDNNEAERSLRPIVVMRKIIGCLRSNNGVKTHETMMSIIATWEKQQKNIFYTLQNTL